MSQAVNHLSARQLVALALGRGQGGAISLPKASVGVLATVENAFVRWQAKRLAEIPRERLHAQLMQDTRSFAEMRRARG